MTGSLAIKHLWLGKENILIIHIGKWVLVNRVSSLLEKHLSSFGLFADDAASNPGNHNAINDYLLWHSPTSIFVIEYMMAI